MKKIFSLMMAMTLCWVSAEACMKKSPASTELTVIVMDTTQALLPEAQVKIGKQVYKTSFDGRVVLKPEQVTSNVLTISCEGYKKAQFTMHNAPLLVAKLTPKASKERGGKGDTMVRGTGLMYRAAGAHYDKAAVSLATAMPMARAESAMADYAVVEEAEEAMEMPPMRPGTETNNAVSAGKLTAGEVNDFAKWNLWSGILDGSHKQYAAEWQIAPRHRYTVQVMNKDGFPIAARAVSLLDNSGNTLFQAVTDNTGKAELWYQLLGNHLCGKHTDFYVRVDDQKQVAKQWAEGGNTFVLDEPCQNDPYGEADRMNEVNKEMANDQMVNDVDVLFVFDATGSMGDELRYLQAEMKDVIARATEATGGLKIRTGAVVYRDHNDEYLTRISRLTDNLKTTQEFIDKQEANGGGDYPEAVPEALMAAMNSSGWNDAARARIAFLILDAPCHQDSATIALLHEQILNAAALGVRIVPVVCSGLGESGELLVRSIALATNGTSFFLTDDSGIGHTHLKPTTDSLKVEHLNDMLVRTIVEFSAMPSCTESNDQMVNDQIVNDFLPNPFSEEDLAADPSIPHGEGVHYLIDISGKLLAVIEGEVKTDMLPIGVYFVKTYYNGRWYTEKILVH